MKTVSILMIAIIAVTATLPTFGIDYEFTDLAENTSAWAAPLNWNPTNGPPGKFDKATIPNGKTCRIETQCTFVDELTIEQGATLEVDDGSIRSLFVFGGVITLDGSLILRGCLHLAIDTTIDTSGPLKSGLFEGDAPPGETLPCIHQGFQDFVCDVDEPVPAGGAPNLTIGEKVTMTGRIEIWTIGDLINNGLIVADDAQDIIQLGLDQADGLGRISGSGVFRVSAGLIFVRGLVVFDPGSSLRWEVSGGTLQFQDNCFYCTEFRGEIVMTGGLMDIDADFCSEDKLEFENATIDVAAGLSAKFSSVCP